jgi:UDP-2-acetamido-2,6-beta-L-arabino-hexul-4-ose reductase
MKAIGITGQNGFIGWHLFNTLGLNQEKFNRVIFKSEYFNDNDKLDHFVNSCDIIIHLAGMNRHQSQETIYQTNISLTQKLVGSLVRTGAQPHVIFSSSLQEEKENLYGKSKLESRLLLQEWAQEYGGTFTGLIIPNVFGPFCKPFYNSVIATFCYQLVNNEIPKIEIDAELNLIYVGDLVEIFLQIIENEVGINKYEVVAPQSLLVSTILEKLNLFKEEYQHNGNIPCLEDAFSIQLFNTFRSYFNHKAIYPCKLDVKFDIRGGFAEIIRTQIGGQFSFSTTFPGITRGNHFHTRKVERFIVVSGDAIIQLRKIDSDEVLNFCLSGDQPSYVDMPIWYTHNITNTGTSELITLFWINEAYDSNNPDTYFENV